MRKAQRAVVQLAVFAVILCFLLFLNRPSYGQKIFSWRHIRYRSPAASRSESRGVCPGLSKTTKPALVVSRMSTDGDPSWLDDLASRYHLCVYTVDAPADPRSDLLQVPANRGHEAMTYLTFLIDNYDHLPAAGMVFVHGSRWAWHNDHPNYDNAALLAALNVPAALEPSGYHNLRCDWSVSTCPSSVAPQGSLQNSFQAVIEPWSARTASDKALPVTLATLFGGGDSLPVQLDRTNTLRSQCCAQFVVSRESAWQHSRDEYVALRQWLLDGAGDRPFVRGAAPRDDRVAGRILSYLWHVLFIAHEGSESAGIDLGRLNQQACPRADECYCRLYGRCGLQHCNSPGSCRGQYSLPKNLKLPDDWGMTH